MDSDGWETLAVGDMITLTTDAPREKQAVDQVGIPVLDQNGLEIVVRMRENRRQPHGAGDHALSQQSDRAEYNSAGKRFLHQWLHDYSAPLLRHHRW